MSGSYKVEVSLERREDGGLRAWSDDLPELVLSHSDADKVMADLPLALGEILSARLGSRVEVEELSSLPSGGRLAAAGRPVDRSARGRRDFVARAA